MRAGLAGTPFQGISHLKQFFLADRVLAGFSEAAGFFSVVLGPIDDTFADVNAGLPEVQFLGTFLLDGLLLSQMTLAFGNDIFQAAFNDYVVSGSPAAIASWKPDRSRGTGQPSKHSADPHKGGIFLP